MDEPNSINLMGPTIVALRQMGGTGKTKVINSTVMGNEGLDPSPELEESLGYARTNLKKRGYVTNPVKGTWHLTIKGGEADTTNLE